MSAEQDVPRYENPNFCKVGIGSETCLQGFHGGKIINGVIHYPQGVQVDKTLAARAQALVDYSYRPGNLPTPNQELEALYGAPYRERFEELKTQKIIRRFFDGVLHHIAK